MLVVSCGVVHGVATGLLGDRDISCGHSGSPQICIRRGADTGKSWHGPGRGDQESLPEVDQIHQRLHLG